MATVKRRSDFFNTEEGLEIKGKLKRMAKDDSYSTGPSYSANSDLYPDNLIPFVDKHMNYLLAHPTIDTHQYISNLRLMTRIK